MQVVFHGNRRSVALTVFDVSDLKNNSSASGKSSPEMRIGCSQCLFLDRRAYVLEK